MAVKPHPGGDPTAGCDATGKLPSFPAGSLKRGIREPEEAASGPVLTQRLQVSGGKRLPAPLHGCEMWDFLARWR